MRRAPRWLERPELERRLDGALTHRLTTLTAAPGYGKSALLERWGEAVGAASHRLGPEDRDLGPFARHVVAALRSRVPELPRELTDVLAGPLGPGGTADASVRAEGLASALGQTLDETLRRDLVLILDGLGVVPEGGQAAQFLDMLLRSAPHRFHLVIASRTPPPFAIDRLRARQQVLELTAADLALDRDEVHRWAAVAIGDDGSLADRIFERTGGWPLAVATLAGRLAKLRTPEERAARLDELATVTGYDQLVDEAFASLPPDEQDLVLLAAALPELDASLASALGLPAARLEELSVSGLLLEAAPDRPETYRASRAARGVLGERVEERRPTLGARIEDAAGWFVDAGRLDLALRTILESGQPAAVEQLLTEHGDELATGPGADTVLTALGHVGPAFAGGADGRRLRGLAHHVLGDWDLARELLASVAQDGGIDATIAWRLGLIHHLRGEIDEALAVYERGRDAPPPDESVICTAMYATARWLRGERDACAEAADDALARALELGEDRPLASAHTVMAMLAALDGERRANDAHYRRALEHAQRAGDAFQLIRIRANRASHHNEEGAYREALAEVEDAARLAELTGFSPFLAVGLSNRAEALLHLGRLEEAAADAADAVATWRRLGSRLVVYGLEQVGMVQRLRGDRAGAVATYTEAVAEAEAASDAQGLVGCLSALAELSCDDDPQQAVTLAERAVGHGTGMGYVAARLAATRAALAAGDRTAARRHLEHARSEAATRRDAPALATALELRAELDADEAYALDAIEAWAMIGDPVARAGAELTWAEIAAGDPARSAQVEEVVTRVDAELHAIGCRLHDDRLAALRRSAPGAEEGAAIGVQTLGGFRVTRDGATMSRSDWQSRKARLLLKLLASQRGEPTAREWLLEHLWPGTDTEVADKRLRVLVSTVRALLDPDRRHTSDHFLVSDRDALRLDLRHVDLDVTRLLEHVEVASRLDRQGRRSDALVRWRAAEAAYTGVFCPEEMYADWSVRTREELRAAYVQACARVAEAESEAGNHDEAVRRWLRLLEADPYDERAHLALVEVLLAAGRRSEARRRYQAYTERVHELGLEAAPFPGS